MCPAKGELESGDAESPVDFLCAVAHLRAMALGTEVPPHGNCAFCRGGAHYPELAEASHKLPEIYGEMKTGNVLAVLNQSSGMCHGCCH
jgi:hypothetical protein